MPRPRSRGLRAEQQALCGWAEAAAHRKAEVALGAARNTKPPESTPAKSTAVHGQGRCGTVHGAEQRITRSHRGRQLRTALLEQKRDVRTERRPQRQRQTSGHCHLFSTTRSLSCRPLCVNSAPPRGHPTQCACRSGARAASADSLAPREGAPFRTAARRRCTPRVQVDTLECAMLLVRPVSPALLASRAILRSEGQRGGRPWPPRQRRSTLPGRSLAAGATYPSRRRSSSSSIRTTAAITTGR